MRKITTVALLILSAMTGCTHYGPDVVVSKDYSPEHTESGMRIMGKALIPYEETVDEKYTLTVLHRLKYMNDYVELNVTKERYDNTNVGDTIK